MAFFTNMGLTLMSVWINNHMPSKVWGEITYHFPNISGCTAEVWEWMSNFIPHILMDVITYPSWDLSKKMFIKRATDVLLASVTDRD